MLLTTIDEVIKYSYAKPRHERAEIIEDYLLHSGIQSHDIPFLITAIINELQRIENRK